MKKYMPFLILYAGLLLFMGGYWLLATMCPTTHSHYMMGESGAVEIITAMGFLGASVIAGMILRYRKQASIWAMIFFTGLALFFFVCAGEELSWGQHLLGFATPEKVAAINEQGEFNLHNLDLEHIHPKDIVSWFMKIYGIILPLILIMKFKAKDSPLRRYLSPPILIPAFVFPEIINLFQKPFDEALVRNLHHIRFNALGLDAYLGSQAEEMLEMYWALAILAAMVCVYGAWTKYVSGKQES